MTDRKRAQTPLPDNLPTPDPKAVEIVVDGKTLTLEEARDLLAEDGGSDD